MKLVNTVVKRYLHAAAAKMQHTIAHPIATQQAVLRSLLHAAADTEWGRRYEYASITSLKAFQDRVPINPYESLKPYIQRMMRGEKDVLWPGRTRQFARSAGTTHDKSKFIPVSRENLVGCHLKGPKATLACWYRDHPESQLFAGKGLIMGGSVSRCAAYPHATIGDISALMMQGMPWYARYAQTPSLAVALRREWSAKMAQMARLAIQEKVTSISGVPTWTLVLLRTMLHLTGARHMLEVFPQFEVYLHGGVNFAPYEEQFRALFPHERVHYREVYNASEGYFATRHHDGDDDLLLLLDNGIVYEFVPLGAWGGEQPTAYGLEDIEVGEHYVMLISTTAGLWRYALGDTVVVTSTRPYKIRLTGRTEQFINAFGEEVMVANTDKALALTCRAMQATVVEYTAAPIYMSPEGKGGHEWLIEFASAPPNLQEFARLLDRNVQSVNSDYAAKREGDMALQALTLHAVPHGTFHQWLKAKGKYGGQHKVPRLANHRTYLEEIREFLGAWHTDERAPTT